MYWSFQELKSRLEHKLKYLAIIYVRRYRKNGREYFKYEEPIFYKLTNFEQFLNLIKVGKIKITFKLSYYHSGDRYGQFLDKGTSFDIGYDYISELFEKIEV